LVWGVFEEGCFSGAPGLHVRQHQVGLWEKKTCDTVGWIRLAALYYVCKLSSCLRILKCGLLRGKRLTLDLGCFTSISQELVCLLLGFGYRRLYLHISDVDRMTSSALLDTCAPSACCHSSLFEILCVTRRSVGRMGVWCF